MYNLTLVCSLNLENVLMIYLTGRKVFFHNLLRINNNSENMLQQSYQVILQENLVFFSNLTRSSTWSYKKYEKSKMILHLSYKIEHMILQEVWEILHDLASILQDSVHDLVRSKEKSYNILQDGVHDLVRSRKDL